MTDLFCVACGHPRAGTAPFCGRCGYAVDATPADEVSVTAADVARTGPAEMAATTNRALLRKTQVRQDDQMAAGPIPVSVAAAAPTMTMAPIRQTATPTPPPPGDGWPPLDPMTSYPPPVGHRGPAPPALWLVLAGLLALAGLIVYPVARFTPDLIKSAFSGDELSRAFATLLLQFVVMFWAAGFALVALAIGLVRGSRVAQLLTIALAVITVVSQLISLSRPDVYGIRPGDGVVAAVVLCAAVVIALVSVPPSVRAFFAADQRPGGVSLAATVNVYLGVVALVDGALICLAGIAGVEYVWIGLTFAVVGAVLIVVSKALRAGSSAGRVLTLVVYGGLAVAVIWFGLARDELGDFPSLLPLGIVVSGAIGLIAPQSSRQHFLGPMASMAMRGPAAVATGIALLLVVACAAFGFHAASTPAPDFSSYQSDDRPNSGPVVPTYGPSQDDARQTATALLDSLEGNGSDPSCSGTTEADLTIGDYQVDDVTETTTGSFDVTADVTLGDGSSLRVTYSVRADSAGGTCVDGDTFTSEVTTPGPSQQSAGATAPTDVPAVVSADDPVPTDASLPEAPSGTVVPYSDAATVPADEGEIVEYQPAGLDTDQAGAVRSVIAFMTQVNRQHFQQAWDYSTEKLVSSSYDATFSHGYRTTHFMQAAFGQPETLSGNLMLVPGRFVSRQDPAAQGSPDGVTDCTYWPQYMFLLARVDGRWLLDVARKYQDRSAVRPYKRMSQSGERLNPTQQRVTC